jgi:Mce-associated membrane protein
MDDVSLDKQPATSWYDVLGVDRDASTGQVQKAWRRRTDKAGPGSPEFARLNEAAEVLLDPGKRAAYDATLPQPVHEPTAPPAPGRGGVREAGWPAIVVCLVLLPLLALAAIGAAAYFTVQHHQDTAEETARTEAPAAAERALPLVLSYDYRHMAADEKRALGYLSSDYAKQYAKTFKLLEDSGDTPGPASQTKTVVTATVVGTAVMDAKPDRVHVLAYVNQVARHGDADPKLAQNRVRVDLVKRGSAWLVAGLDPA